MRELARRVAFALALACANACAGAGVTDAQATISFGGLERTYVVAMPDSCRSACPLVLDLHGYQGSGSRIARHSGIRAQAQAAGYVAVFPDGIANSWNAGRGPYGGCCGVAMKDKVDDVAFLKDVVARVAAAYPVDRSRVYVTGWSNGCAMAQRLLAEASEVFAAGACTGHFLLTMQKSLARPVSVTEIHGRDDDSYREADDHTGARENAARWAALDRCAAAPVHARVGRDSDIATWSGCAGGVRVRLVTLAHTGHDTYGNDEGVDVAGLMWDSVRDERLPTP